MNKNIICFLFSLLTMQVNAGVFSFTMHSRANCVNNESISWQGNQAYYLRTISRHYYNHYLAHIVDSEWDFTKRSAAVHWGEGRGGWYVVGLHYEGVNGNPYLIGQTAVPDCSIYDGWWD